MVATSSSEWPTTRRIRLPMSFRVRVLCITLLCAVEPTGSTALTLCDVFPDRAALSMYCSVQVWPSTVGQLARAFRVARALDSAATGLVLLDSDSTTLSVGTVFSAADDAAEKVSSDARAGSLVLRRRFMGREIATGYERTLLRAIRDALDCTPNSPSSDWPDSLECQSRTAGSPTIRFVWSNASFDAAAAAPFEFSIIGRFK